MIIRTRNALRELRMTWPAETIVYGLATQCIDLIDQLGRARANQVISHPVRKREGPLSAQCKRVLRFMQTVGSVTCYDTPGLLIGHLPRRILDLKEHGYAIKTEMVKRKNQVGKYIRIAKYSLEKSSPRGPS